MCMEAESNIFYDRFIFIVESQNLQSNGRPSKPLKDYRYDFIIKLYTNMCQIHESMQTTYNLSGDAQAQKDSPLDEQARDFNSQYRTVSG